MQLSQTKMERAKLYAYHAHAAANKVWGDFGPSSHIFCINYHPGLGNKQDNATAVQHH